MSTRIDNEVITLTAGEAQLLAFFADAGRKQVRSMGLAVPDIEPLLAELRAATRAGTARGTSQVPQVDDSGSGVGESEWLTAEQAAAQLGISTRAVRKIATGHLAGVKGDDGIGAWKFPKNAVDKYTPTRRQLPTHDPCPPTPIDLNERTPDDSDPDGLADRAS